MSSYDEMVEKDLQLMWSIQSFCHRTPWLNEKMAFITSKNPMKDIVIVIWLFFVIGVIELKEKHFWVAVSNLVFSFGTGVTQQYLW